jgi:hypothetical protein
MASWKYKLEAEGKKLRQFIDEEKEAEIIEQLQLCYKSLINKLSPEDKENYGDSVEESYYLLDGEADTIRNNPDEIINEWGFDSITELIDERLAEFYDHCDDVKCWVGI